MDAIIRSIETYISPTIVRYLRNAETVRVINSGYLEYVKLHIKFACQAVTVSHCEFPSD